MGYVGSNLIAYCRSLATLSAGALLAVACTSPGVKEAAEIESSRPASAKFPPSPVGGNASRALSENENKIPVDESHLPPREKLSHGCKKMQGNLVSSYRALFRFVSPEVRTRVAAAPTWPVRLLGAASLSCDDREELRQIIGQTKPALLMHERLGIILPLTGTDRSAGQEILAGIKSAAEEQGFPFDELVDVRDSQSLAREAQRHLADLVFEGKAVTFIGGATSEEAKVLLEWSRRLLLPVFLLSSDAAIATGSRFAFRVFPDQRALARVLVAGLTSRQLKRLAIFRPTSGKGADLVQMVKTEAESAGITVTDEVTYTSGSYESMEAAAFQALRIDAADRQAALEELTRKAQEEADLAGVPLNPRFVFLKAEPNFEAVFIPDDFRTVRHFAKIFKYFDAKDLTWVGNHEWRSPALLTPPEPMLEGAFFADFVGSYSDLPIPLRPLTEGQTLFVESDLATIIDLRLIGYRAGSLAFAGFQSRTKTRIAFIRSLARMKWTSGLFKAERPFDERRASVWPAFLFGVSGDAAVPIGEK